MYCFVLPEIKPCVEDDVSQSKCLYKDITIDIVTKMSSAEEPIEQCVGENQIRFWTEKDLFGSRLRREFEPCVNDDISQFNCMDKAITIDIVTRRIGAGEPMERCALHGGSVSREEEMGIARGDARCTGRPKPKTLPSHIPLARFQANVPKR